MADFLNDAFATARQFQGLAAVKQQMEEQTRQQENIKLGTEALNKYRESVQAGTPDEMSMTTALIYHPEAAKNVLAHVGIQDQLQKRDAANFIMQAAAAGDDPEKLLSLTRSRLSYLKQGQRDPTHTGQLEQMLSSGDIAGAKSSIKGIAAALVGDGSLDKKAYDLAYGPAPGSMDDYQKATIALKNKELGLDAQRLGIEAQRLGAAQSAGMSGTSNQKDWATYQQLLITDPEAAKTFGRAAGFVSKEGTQLSGFSEKQIATASDEYNNASSAAARYATLAEQIRAKSIGGGLPSTWAETLKDLSGNQDEITQLKRSVMEVVNSEAIKALPPGPATDRDIALVREPFPTAKANGEYIANWLGAVARLNEKRAQYAEHKASFIAKNGGQRDPETGETVLSSWKKLQASESPSDTGQLFKDADAIIGGQ